VSCTVFEDDQLWHPGANRFGCEPDYCAYTKETNPPPRPKNRNLRSAGGHIHVETELDKFEVVKAMDLFEGVPSMFMDADGKRRKKMYGKAGACRPKPYGVEYRSLSNYWVFTPQLRDWVWRNTERALAFVSNYGKVPDDLRTVIDKDNLDRAKEIINEYDLEVIT